MEVMEVFSTKIPRCWPKLIANFVSHPLQPYEHTHNFRFMCAAPLLTRLPAPQNTRQRPISLRCPVCLGEARA
jgi:hypothetical protein